MAAKMFTNVNNNGFTLYKEGTPAEIFQEYRRLKERASKKGFRELYHTSDECGNLIPFVGGTLASGFTTVDIQICNSDIITNKFLAKNTVH